MVIVISFLRSLIGPSGCFLALYPIKGQQETEELISTFQPASYKYSIVTTSLVIPLPSALYSVNSRQELSTYILRTQHTYTITMFRSALVRSLRSASTQAPRASALPAFRTSFAQTTKATPSLALRFYSAPAGLSKPEVEGRIVDLLKNFDKVRHGRSHLRQKDVD